jgi:hypothetical protein
MMRFFLLLVVVCFSQVSSGQPPELQLADDSRALAAETRTAAKESRLECESLAVSCQAWIVAVSAVSFTDAMSFQMTLNVINRTRAVRSETEGEIDYSKGLQYLASARIAWQMYQDEELAKELAEMSIESYSEAESIFDDVLTNNEARIELLQALLFRLQQFFGLDTGERSFV